MADDDEYDAEAALEQELAALGSKDETDGLALPSGWVTDDTADTAGSGDEDDEPESFKALQDAFSRRDRQCEQLLHELQSAAQHATTALGTDSHVQLHPSSHAPPCSQAADPSTAAQAGQLATPATTASVLRAAQCASVEGGEPQGGACRDSDVTDLSAPLPVTAVSQAVVALQHIVARSRPVTPLDRPPPVSKVQSVTSNSAHDVPVATDDDAGRRLERLLEERRAVVSEAQAVEAHREAERAKQRLQEQSQLQQEALAAQAAAQQLAEQLATQQAHALAELQAQQMAAQQQLEEQQQRDAAEAAQRWAEQQRVQQLLKEQELAAQERQAALAAVQEEARVLMAAELGRNHAARRIQRAWPRYWDSSQRHTRHGHVILLQAAWRARVARLQLRALQQRRQAEAQLVAAALSQSPEALRKATDLATETGLPATEIQQRVAAARQRCQQLLGALSRAASQGSAVDFRAALEAAQKVLPAESEDLRQAVAAFEQRKAAAMSAAQAAVVDKPMQEVTKAVDAVAVLGGDPGTIASLLDQARQRDTSIRVQLSEAVASDHFDITAFAALSSHAAQLGLKGDVAAAQTVVNRRKRQLAARLAAGTRDNDAAANAGLVKELRMLGMVSEAESLAKEESDRADRATRGLMVAATQGTPDDLLVLLEQAQHNGVPEATQQRMRGLLAQRQARAQEDLMHAATHGSLVSYRHARRAALRCGALDALNRAEAAFAQRQAAACSQVTTAVQQLAAQLPASRTSQKGSPSVAVQIYTAAGLGDFCDAAVSQTHHLPHSNTADPFPSQVSHLGGLGLLPAGAAPLAALSAISYAHTALQLPAELPAPLLQGGSTAGSLHPWVQSVWSSVVCALRLGLHTAVHLSLGALHVLQQAHSAGGHRLAGFLHTALGATGELLGAPMWSQLTTTLPSPLWQAANQVAQLDGAPLAADSGSYAGGPSSDGPGGRPGQPGKEVLFQDAVKSSWAECSRQSETGTVWLWPPALPAAAVRAQLVQVVPSAGHVQAAGSSVYPAPHAAPQAAAAPRAAAASMRAPGVPLTRQLVGSVAGPGVGVDGVRKLDLSLERLSSVEGLDQWCPLLQVLVVSGNQLESFSGCERLVHLSDLNACGNCLTTLHGLAAKSQPHTALWRLQLDSNQIDTLNGLDQLPNLSTLSLTDNQLCQLPTPSASTLAAAHPASPPRSLAACCPLLTVLSLAGNRLTHLSGLGACEHLQHLDVSRNYLTTLQGVSDCRRLQTLAASRNQLTLWPAEQLAPLLQLLRLDVTSNQIANLSTGHPAPTPPTNPASLSAGAPTSGAYLVLPPALEDLVLRDNCITQLPQLLVAPRLLHLDLSFNNLTTCDSLRALAGLTSLQHLHLTDNPVTAQDHYQQTVQIILPGLLEYDNRSVPPSQQLQQVVRAAMSSPAVAEVLREVSYGCGSHSVAGSVSMGGVAAAVQAAREVQAARVRDGEAEAHLGLLRVLLAASSQWQWPDAGWEGSQGAGRAAGVGRLCNSLYQVADAQRAELRVAAQVRLRPPATANREVAHAPAGADGDGSPQGPEKGCFSGHRSSSVMHVGLPAATRPMHQRLQSLAISLRGFRPSSVESSNTSRQQGSVFDQSPHSGDEAVAWSQYEQGYEQTVRALHHQHSLQLGQLDAGATAGQLAASQHAGSGHHGVVLVTGGEFYQRRRDCLDRATCRIQAAWRGTLARKHAAVLRSAHHAALRETAATCIQAAWRGNRVRHGADLKARMRALAARREADQLLREEAEKAAAAAALKLQTSAAVTLQAAVRSWLVRRKLSAALKAARYQDEDEFEYGGVGDDFLADIESIITKEQLQVPVQAAPKQATAVRSPGQAVDNPQAVVLAVAAAPNPGLLSSVPALAKAFAARGGAAGMSEATRAAWGSPSVAAADATSSSPAGQALPSTAGSPAGPALKPVPHNPQSLLPPLSAHDDTHTADSDKAAPAGLKHAWSHQPPPPLFVDDQGSYTSQYGGSQAGDVASKAGSVYAESYTSVSPTAKAAQLAARQQRHLEKMEALMAEWGFKDIATAEAYWRRQQRQTHGDTRRKLEAKFRDPAQRLKKLQEAVDGRPKLRQEDLQHKAVHGPEVPLRHGSLQGPPSREAGAAVVPVGTGVARQGKVSHGGSPGSQHGLPNHPGDAQTVGQGAVAWQGKGSTGGMVQVLNGLEVDGYAGRAGGWARRDAARIICGLSPDLAHTAGFLAAEC